MLMWLSAAYQSGAENSDILLGNSTAEPSHPRASATSQTEGDQIVIEVSDADIDISKGQLLAM